MDILRVDDLVKTFQIEKKNQKIMDSKENKKIAVNHVGFTARSGEIFGLLGPNGAGKTTTMRIISSLIKPDSGNVYFNDIDVVSNPELVRSKLAFLTTDLKLDMRTTANEMFDFFAALYHIPAINRTARKAELFERFGIDQFADTRINKLSQGMRQKVSIAISVIHDPQFIIFDEPTNGLDIIATRDVRNFILQMKEEGKCVIVSTHIFDLVEKLCDRVAMIIDGKLVIEGKINDIMQDKSLEDAFYDYYSKHHN